MRIGTSVTTYTSVIVIVIVIMQLYGNSTTVMSKVQTDRPYRDSPRERMERAIAASAGVGVDPVHFTYYIWRKKLIKRN